MNRGISQLKSYNVLPIVTLSKKLGCPQVDGSEMKILSVYPASNVVQVSNAPHCVNRRGTFNWNLSPSPHWQFKLIVFKTDELSTVTSTNAG